MRVRCSLSAVSKPNFARKYALESSRRDLQNALLCTVLKAHIFVEKSPNFFCQFCKHFTKFNRFVGALLVSLLSRCLRLLLTYVVSAIYLHFKHTEHFRNNHALARGLALWSSRQCEMMIFGVLCLATILMSWFNTVDSEAVWL